MLAHFRLDLMPGAGRAPKRIGRDPLWDLRDPQGALPLWGTPACGAIPVQCYGGGTFLQGQSHSISCINVSLRQRDEIPSGTDKMKRLQSPQNLTYPSNQSLAQSAFLREKIK